MLRFPSFISSKNKSSYTNNFLFLLSEGCSTNVNPFSLSMSSSSLFLAALSRELKFLISSVILGCCSLLPDVPGFLPMFLGRGFSASLGSFLAWSALLPSFPSLLSSQLFLTVNFRNVPVICGVSRLPEACSWCFLSSFSSLLLSGMDLVDSSSLHVTFLAWPPP